MNDQSEFFVAGGTLPEDAPSYVTRPADQELFDALLRGEFCYVLTARQMGKSSLMVRTAGRLKQHGITAISIDLTRIGTAGLDHWYQGLLTRIQRELHLNVQVRQWWQARQTISASERLVEFLRNVVLATISGPVVIFIDEIDSMLRLDFRDDFFAAIRAMYNARASDPVFKRLTFALLGVATPTDLIQDRERTPFNIGRRIVLQEFSTSDAVPLRSRLEASYPCQGEHILARIIYWTNGHPYLTQHLCITAMQQTVSNWDDHVVDTFAASSFFADKARRDSNLQFVQRYVSESPDAERRRMLQLYRRVFDDKVVIDDDRSEIQNRLELCGLVRESAGQLEVRNRIYAHVFNTDWIQSTMPRDREKSTTRFAVVVAGMLVVAALIVAIVVNLFHTSENIQAERCRTNFQESDKYGYTIRLDALACLFALGPKYDEQALRLFYGLPPQEQIDLFTLNNPQQVGDEIEIVIRKVYLTVDRRDDNRDLDLLEAMSQALNDSVQYVSAPDQRSAREQLSKEIANWQLGRMHFKDKDYPGAIDAYSASIAQDADHPIIHYDHAMVYVALGQETLRQDYYADALRDLDAVIEISDRTPEPPTPTPPTGPASTLSSTSSTSTSQPESTASDSLIPISPTATPVVSLREEIIPFERQRFVNRQRIRETVEKTINEIKGLRTAFWETNSQAYGHLRTLTIQPELTPIALESTTVGSDATSIVALPTSEAPALTLTASSLSAEADTATVAVLQTATAEILAVTISTTPLPTETATAPPLQPTNTRVPLPSITRTPTPTSFFMAVNKVTDNGPARCINVHLFLPSGFRGTGWTLVAEGLGIGASFNDGGYAALCVPRDRQEFTFAILPPRGITATGNHSIPARGGDNFEAYTRAR